MVITLWQHVCFQNRGGQDHPHLHQQFGPRKRLSMPATVWKGYLSFGLVSFPVRLFTAARAETVHFHMLHKKDQSRVREVWYCVQEDKPIDRADIEKGYEISKGTQIEQPRKAPVIDLMEALKRSLKSSSGSSKESATSGKSRKKTQGRRKAA